MNTDLETERFLEVFKNTHADMFSDFDADIVSDFEVNYLSELGFFVIDEEE